VVSFIINALVKVLLDTTLDLIWENNNVRSARKVFKQKQFNDQCRILRLDNKNTYEIYFDYFSNLEDMIPGIIETTKIEYFQKNII
jgi:hypothetical protein